MLNLAQTWTRARKKKGRNLADSHFFLHFLSCAKKSGGIAKLFFVLFLVKKEPPKELQFCAPFWQQLNLPAQTFLGTVFRGLEIEKKDTVQDPIEGEEEEEDEDISWGCDNIRRRRGKPLLLRNFSRLSRLGISSFYLSEKCHFIQAVVVCDTSA